MRSRQIIRLLESVGFVKVGQRGSHAQFKHPARTGRVTVPHPHTDVPIGTVKSIERQSGVKLL
jgi:predicted RNA binding protein YcfA (HicA-like mRNA interferase family)